MHLFLEADFVLMPYNVPGGQSGVLEMSSFFGNNVICLDFPEFREEVKEGDQITLVDQKMFYKEIERHLINFKSSKRKIEVGKKINSAKENIDEFVKRALATKES